MKKLAVFLVLPLLLGVFLLGMLTRSRGNDLGTCVAMLCGFAVVILLEIGGRQGWLPGIAFPWRVTVGTLVTFAVGCLFRTPASHAAQSQQND